MQLADSAPNEDNLPSSYISTGGPINGKQTFRVFSDGRQCRISSNISLFDKLYSSEPRTYPQDSRSRRDRNADGKNTHMDDNERRPSAVARRMRGSRDRLMAASEVSWDRPGWSTMRVRWLECGRAPVARCRSGSRESHRELWSCTRWWTTKESHS